MSEQAPIPAGFVHQFEAERARTLRRRIGWYCGLALALLAFSVGGTLMDLQGPPAERPPLAAISFDLSADAAYALLHIAMLVYVLVRDRTREKLVSALSALMIGVGAIAVLTTPLSDNSSVLSQARPMEPGAAAFAQQLVTLLSIFVLHFLASLLVALSPLEGLRIFVPLWLVYCGALLFVRGVPVPGKMVLLALSPLTGLPGMAWSWWRHRSFRERFLGRVVARRFDEMSKELTDARRVHEALFPPPVTRGPVRVGYAYEPMREIGGDFLFIRPLAFPPSEPGVPLSVVLIDVTGHGVPAALAVNRIHDTLARAFHAEPGIGPARALRELNHFAFEALSAQGMYATAVCIRVEAGEGGYVLRWANAGHPPPVILGRAGAGIRLGATAPMLGAVPGDLFEPGEEAAAIGAGDLVVAYTDGATETKDKGGEMLGLDGVAAMIARAAATNGAEQTAARMLKELEELRAGPPADDTLIVQIWIEPGA